MNVALKRQKYWAYAAKKDPTIHITVALLSRIMQNVVDMNNNEQETEDDLLANEDYFIINSKNLIVILLVKNEQQVAFL